MIVSKFLKDWCYGGGSPRGVIGEICAIDEQDHLNSQECSSTGRVS